MIKLTMVYDHYFKCGGKHMTIDKKTPYGGINISMEAISVVAGSATAECYGVVGITSKYAIKDDTYETLTKDNLTKGVISRKGKDGYEVDLYIIVAYGVKITEVITEVQKKVKYVLEKTFDIKFKAINVYVQSMKVL
jgi:uncharacterized alkaline shock family protein YloU